MKEVSHIEVENFMFGISKVVPSSDPSVIIFELFKDNWRLQTIALLPDEALLLAKTLIEHVIEPEE